jgi:hypoxanthine phosphoribosyltransferase
MSAGAAEHDLPAPPPPGSIVYSSDRIAARVAELGADISADYAHDVPVLVTVLTGATVFAADLARELSVQHEMDFLAISAYGEHDSGDHARVLKDLQHPVNGRSVLLVEDVVDTGLTLGFLLQWIHGKEPRSVDVVTLLDRPHRRLVDVPIRYRGFVAPDRFLVGYGFDYRQQYRGLPDMHELPLDPTITERLLSNDRLR